MLTIQINLIPGDLLLRHHDLVQISHPLADQALKTVRHDSNLLADLLEHRLRLYRFGSVLFVASATHCIVPALIIHGAAVLLQRQP